MRLSRLLCGPALLVVVACSGGDAGDAASLATVRSAAVGGCACPTSGNCAALTYSDIPSDDTYYVTTFGGGSDTQPMACGGTADSTWAYVAGSGRFGCGAKLRLQAGGKSCVAEVADCGPNRCVEDAASNTSCASHVPIIDASPFITSYLLGSSSFGWSDHQAIVAVEVDASTPIGCPGGPVGTGGAAGSGGSGNSSGTGGMAGVPGAGGGGAGVAGAGGTGVAGASGFPGCSASPDCNACSGCLETCRCLGRGEQQCTQDCNSPGSGASGSTIASDSGDDGSCSVAPSRRGSSRIGLVALLALLALGWRRRG